MSNPLPSSANTRKDAQIRIGLHCVAKSLGERAECGIHAAVGLLDACAACKDMWVFQIVSRLAAMDTPSQ